MSIVNCGGNEVGDAGLSALCDALRGSNATLSVWRWSIIASPTRVRVRKRWCLVVNQHGFDNHGASNKGSQCVEELG